MKPIYSPWGEVQTSKILAEGIVQVSTAGHGGILLSPERYDQMPACFKGTFAGGAAYEEDCDWAMVAVVFPSAFTPTAVAGAYRTLRHTMKDQPTALRYLENCAAKAIADAEETRTAQMWRIGSCGSPPRGLSGWSVTVSHNTTGRSLRGVMADLPRQHDLTDAELETLWTVPPADIR